MADFNSTQAQLAAARTAHDAAQLAALHAAAKAHQAQAALDLATRQASPRGDAQSLSQLGAADIQASASQTAAQKAVESARVIVVQATSAFAIFNIPQQNVALLNDSSPFLLFPVRIETRFHAQS
jgi:hypothetical protein